MKFVKLATVLSQLAGFECCRFPDHQQETAFNTCIPYYLFPTTLKLPYFMAATRVASQLLSTSGGKNNWAEGKIIIGMEQDS